MRIRDETLERESRGGRERRGLFVGVRERESEVCLFVVLKEMSDSIHLLVF